MLDPTSISPLDDRDRENLETGIDREDGPAYIARVIRNLIERERLDLDRGVSLTYESNLSEQCSRETQVKNIARNVARNLTKGFRVLGTPIEAIVTGDEESPFRRRVLIRKAKERE